MSSLSARRISAVRALAPERMKTPPPNLKSFSTSIYSSIKPLLWDLRRAPAARLEEVQGAVKGAYHVLLDAVVDSMFSFVDQRALPTQSNFVPVDEIGEAAEVVVAAGEIPAGFPEGIYIRNGSNPLFGALQSVVSPLGSSSHIWVEGEGMLHALYFNTTTTGDGVSWKVFYKNRYVESETFKLERERNRPCFLPAVEGDSPVILAAYFFNLIRFGKVNKDMSNTNVFEHAGRLYSVSEHHIPQCIDKDSLCTRGDWDVNKAWDRPFASHPKRAPGTGELVTIGVDAVKPYVVLGVISADGTQLVHKADLKIDRSILSHDIGVTERYNVIIDMPLTVDVNRLIRGGPLIKFIKESYARIGVMPRYGDADTVKWFEVESNCTFHIINCYEDGNAVIVRGCRSLDSMIPGPDFGVDKFQWFSRGLKQRANKEDIVSGHTDEGYLFHRPYEWRLNMETGEVRERYLTSPDISMDFPMINDSVSGLYNKYAYTQVVDPVASSLCGLAKYGGLAKLCFEEEVRSDSVMDTRPDDFVRVQHHLFGRSQFCSGSAFVSKPGSTEEDDGWIMSFVHDEETNQSQVHIIDAKRFECDPVAVLTLPRRVPYGFHGTFIAS